MEEAETARGVAAAEAESAKAAARDAETDLREERAVANRAALAADACRRRRRDGVSRTRRGERAREDRDGFGNGVDAAERAARDAEARAVAAEEAAEKTRAALETTRAELKNAEAAAKTAALRRRSRRSVAARMPNARRRARRKRRRRVEGGSVRGEDGGVAGARTRRGIGRRASQTNRGDRGGGDAREDDGTRARRGDGGGGALGRRRADAVRAPNATDVAAKAADRRVEEALARADRARIAAETRAEEAKAEATRTVADARVERT